MWRYKKHVVVTFSEDKWDPSVNMERHEIQMCAVITIQPKGIVGSKQ